MAKTTVSTGRLKDGAEFFRRDGSVVATGDWDMGGHSITGLSGGGIDVNFAYGDATPLALGTVLANKVIESVRVYITTAFDGIGAALSVGNVGSVSSLMTTGQNDPTELGGYETTPAIKFGVDTDLVLAITPGAGATQGAGVVAITFQQ